MGQRPPLDNPPIPPVRPDKNDCCNSGCSPCIFDLYEEELERYRAELSKWEARRAKTKTDGQRSARR